MKRLPVLGLLLLFALGGAYTSYYLQTATTSGDKEALTEARKALTPTAMLGQPQPPFSLRTLDGSRMSSAEWAGQVLLINFWASWCPPCRREIPQFIEVRDFYHDQGFEIVGIALDDPEAVQEFLDAYPQMNYPQLYGDIDASEVARMFGNHQGSLPYSVLVDADGIIRFVKFGELDRTTLIEQLEPLLEG